MAIHPIVEQLFTTTRPKILLSDRQIGRFGVSRVSFLGQPQVLRWRGPKSPVITQNIKNRIER